MRLRFGDGMLHRSGLNGQISLQKPDTPGLLGPRASAKVLDCARSVLCVYGVCLPKRAGDAEPTAAGMGGSAHAGGGRLMGRGQAVRRGTLNPVFEGSNPSAPTKWHAGGHRSHCPAVRRGNGADLQR